MGLCARWYHSLYMCMAEYKNKISLCSTILEVIGMFCLDILFTVDFIHIYSIFDKNNNPGIPSNTPSWSHKPPFSHTPFWLFLLLSGSTPPSYPIRNVAWPPFKPSSWRNNRLQSYLIALTSGPTQLSLPWVLSSQLGGFDVPFSTATLIKPSECSEAISECPRSDHLKE